MKEYTVTPGNLISASCHDIISTNTGYNDDYNTNYNLVANVLSHLKIMSPSEVDLGMKLYLDSSVKISPLRFKGIQFVSIISDADCIIVSIPAIREMCFSHCRGKICYNEEGKSIINFKLASYEREGYNCVADGSYVYSYMPTNYNILMNYLSMDNMRYIDYRNILSYNR